MAIAPSSAVVVILLASLVIVPAVLLPAVISPRLLFPQMNMKKKKRIDTYVKNFVVFSKAYVLKNGYFI